jgi:hypothetical protein
MANFGKLRFYPFENARVAFLSSELDSSSKSGSIMLIYLVFIMSISTNVLTVSPF